MSPSISIAVLLALVVLVTADYRPEPYRINFGVQNFTRLIDEFTVVSPAKPFRQIKLSLEYPSGVSTLIHRLSIEKHNFQIILCSCMGL